MNQRQTNPSAAQSLPWALGFWSLLGSAMTMIMGGILWRSSSAELDLALPVLVNWSRSVPALILLGGGLVLTVALFVLVCRRAKAAGLLRLWWAFSLHYTTIFFYIWFLLPATEVKPIHWIIGVGFVLIVMTLTVPRSRLVNPLHGNWGARPYLYLDGLMVLVPALVWLYFRDPIDAERATVSLFTYPAYALVQLLALLVLPSMLMQSLKFPRREIVVVCATMFGLVHWPNPVVMAATFGAMIVWAMAHLGGRRFVVSALVMGVAATSFTRFMPDTWTENMKVGPGLVRLRVVDQLGGEVQYGEGFELNTVNAETFLVSVYPAIIGRDITKLEVENWNAALMRGLRGATLYFLTLTPEYKALADEGLRPAPPKGGLHWTQASAEWHEHYAEFYSEEYWQAHGANMDDFFQATWSYTFMKEWPVTAKPFTSELLSPNQCRRLVEVLHEQRGKLEDKQFEGITDEELVWVRH